MKLIESNVSMFVFEGYTWFTTPLIEHFDHVGFSCYSSTRAGLFKWNKECMSTENTDNKKGKGNNTEIKSNTKTYFFVATL